MFPLIRWICTMQLSFRLDKRPGESHRALDRKKETQPQNWQKLDFQASFQAEKQGKKRTGQGPTKTTTTKFCHRHSGEKPLCRNSQKDAPNELVATQKSETRVLNCCCWQTRKDSISCTLLQSSLSESTSSCGCRVQNGGFRSRKSKLFRSQITVPGVCCFWLPLSRLHVAPRHQSCAVVQRASPSSAHSAFLRVCPLCLSWALLSCRFCFLFPRAPAKGSS